MFQRYGIEVVVSDSASANLRGITGESRRTASSLGQLGSGGASSLRSIGSSASMMGGLVSAGTTMAIAGITALTAGAAALGSEVIGTTSSFEKLEAMLSTSLGSDSAAKREMNRIAELAASTPFQVEELTQGFLKMGKLTNEEMIRMGDLASSRGKSFDQYTEAVLDAQMGEFERLKEFGIKASAAGDKVSFSFRGQTQTVQKSEQAIRQYLIGLGAMPGVAGNMVKVSATMGSQISNLKDNFTALTYTIGTQFRPAIMAGIGAGQDMVKGLDKWLQANPKLIGQLAEAGTSLVRYGSSALSLAGTLAQRLAPAVQNSAALLGGLWQAGGDLLDWAERQIPLIDKLTGSMLRLNKTMTQEDVYNGIYGFMNIFSGDGKFKGGEGLGGYVKRKFNEPFEENRLKKEAYNISDLGNVMHAFAKSRGAASWQDVSVLEGGKKMKLSEMEFGAAMDLLRKQSGIGQEELAKLKDPRDLMRRLMDDSKEQAMARQMATANAAGGEKKDKNSGLSPVEGSRKEIKHITINIAKMIEGGFNVHTVTYKEGVNRAADILQEGLLKAINDAQIMFG